MKRTDRSRNPQRVVADVEQDILFGRLRPRERVTEDGLIERFDITRHAARQALIELERMGMVVREPNRGAAVRDFSREEVEQITAVRELLHARAASLIPMPAPPALLRGLAALQRAHADAVAHNDPGAIHAANNAFHDMLFTACGNKYLAQTIRDYAQMSLAFRCHLMTSPWHAQQARDEHAAMIKALKRGDRRALIRLCVDHIRPSKNVYMILRGWVAPERPRRRARAGSR